MTTDGSVKPEEKTVPCAGWCEEEVIEEFAHSIADKVTRELRFYCSKCAVRELTERVGAVRADNFNIDVPTMDSCQYWRRGTHGR